MLSSASMANFPKSRTSATCPARMGNKSTASAPTLSKEVGTPARMGNKSTASAPTLSKEVGTPARFYTDELQVLQRSFNKDRKAF